MAERNLIKVAIIQLYPEPVEVEKNYRKAAKFIEEAAKAGASLAVLPEYCLTGWLPEDERFREAVNDQSYIVKFQDLARKLDINIVPGTLVEKHKREGDSQDVLYNRVYFISRRGEVIGQYTKRNLWGPERNHLTGSKHVPHDVFETEYGSVGFLVCWDLAFPEAFRQLVAKGAKIIIIPSFWTLKDCNEYGLKLNPQSEVLFMDSTLVTRAYENSVAVIYVNAGGPAKEGYAGCSQVAMPFLGPVGRADGCEEQMKIITMDMEILEQAESNYQVRSDLLSSDWGYPYDYTH